MYLAAQGMRVLVTSDGVTPIRMAVAYRPDVIVTDQYLPLIDGSEAIRPPQRCRCPLREGQPSARDP